MNFSCTILQWPSELMMQSSLSEEDYHACTQLVC